MTGKDHVGVSQLDWLAGRSGDFKEVTDDFVESVRDKNNFGVGEFLVVVVVIGIIVSDNIIIFMIIFIIILLILWL